MIDTVERAFESIDRLGEAEEMARSAAAKLTAAPCLSNAHIHLPPNFSAFETIPQAVALAAEQGVRVLGASNYHDYGVYAGFARETAARGIFPLFGIEIIALDRELQEKGVLVNDPGNPGRVYLCGKGITRFGPLTEEAGRLLDRIRQGDAERMRLMLARLAEIFRAAGIDTGLDEAQVIDGIVRRHGAEPSAVCLQERHLAQAFQEALFRMIPPGRRAGALARLFGAAARSAADDPVGVQQEIRARLMKVDRPAFVPERFLDYDESFRLILELGGIPCYPTLADGASPICAYEDPPERLVESLRARRLHAAEFIPIRNRPETLERYVRALRFSGFVITAGTEHNTLDLIPLEPRCLGGAPLPEGLLDIFWEGACVSAAHQFLVRRSLCGYVDGRGDPHPGYSGAEERIRFFRGLGAAVIERYHRLFPGQGAQQTDA